MNIFDKIFGNSRYDLEILPVKMKSVRRHRRPPFIFHGVSSKSKINETQFVKIFLHQHIITSRVPFSRTCIVKIFKYSKVSESNCLLRYSNVFFCVYVCVANKIISNQQIIWEFLKKIAICFGKAPFWKFLSGKLSKFWKIKAGFTLNIAIEDGWKVFGSIFP